MVASSMQEIQLIAVIDCTIRIPSLFWPWFSYARSSNPITFGLMAVIMPFINISVHKVAMNVNHGDKSKQNKCNILILSLLIFSASALHVS